MTALVLLATVAFTLVVLWAGARLREPQIRDEGFQDGLAALERALNEGGHRE